MANIDLMPMQRRILSMPEGVHADYALYQGGWGCGKSFTGALFGFLRCCQHPGSRGVVVSDTLRRLKRTTLDSYRQLFALAGWRRKVDYIWRETDSELILPTVDGLIHFIGLGEGNDPTDVRSLNADWIHIEEGSLLPEPSFIELVGRLRGGKGPPRVLITTNPQDRKGWLYKWFVTKAGVHAEIVDGQEIRTSIRRVIAPTLDNKHLPAAYIAGLKTLDEKTYRMNVLGEDGDYTEGLVCYNFGFANIDDTAVYDDKKRLYLSCDFNADPNCWMVAHRVGAEYHFIDEFCLEYSSTTANATAFLAKYGAHGAGVVVLGDATGSSNSSQGLVMQSTREKLDWKGNYLQIKQVFDEHGWSEGRHYASDKPAANPRIADRVRVWNKLTRSLDGKIRIKINPRCKWLIWNCETLRWVSGGENNAFELPTRRDIEHNNDLKFTEHPFAAASYLPARYETLVEDRPTQVQRVVMAGFTPRRLA